MTSTERQRDLLRTLSMATDNLDGALAEVIRRATAARVALAAGNRPESGAVGSILASTPSKVDVYAGRVEALTEALSIVGIPDEETYLQAYRPRRR